MRRVVMCRAQTPKKELNGREDEFSSAAESKISPSGPAGPLPKALRTSFANLFLPEPILINSHVFPYTLLFRGNKGVAGRGVLCGKKTTRKTFSTRSFYPAGSLYPTG